MGKIYKPLPVKLIVGLICCRQDLFSRAQKLLSSRFGRTDLQSKILPFDFTDYYQEELGDNLKRRFLSFRRLIPPEQLADIKLFTNRLEQKFSSEGRRMINIDPGYLTPAKLVLASTKDFYHRIYLRKGIFAEVTTHYSAGKFRSFEWTYPDYRSREYLAIFKEIRDLYLKQLKKRINA